MNREKKRGVLVIHGLTGTPATMKPIVDQLISDGYIVNAPLLPGHGTELKDLTKVCWEDWCKLVEDSYYALKEEVDTVSVVGLSLGSLLALKLVSENGFDVRSVVAMGTPIVLAWPIEYLAYPLVNYSPIRCFYKYQNKDWDKTVADPEGQQYYKNHSYQKTPIHAVLEIFKLKKIVREKLPQIKVPVGIFHGKHDRVAPPRNVEILKRSILSDVDITVFDCSEHVISLDYDREDVAKAVVAFLDRFS